MKFQKKTVKKLTCEALAVTAGSVLFSMSLNMFLVPAGVVLGGMTGISTVINIFSGAPIGLMIIILNIPLVAISAYFFGADFLRRTVIGIAATSAAADVFNFFPITETDPLMCSILGGLSMGAGVGILLSRGYTTGGTDLISCLVKLKWKKISTGTLVMICDLMIICGAAVITGDLNGIFYSVICTWISGRVMDIMLSGERRAAQTFIVTENAELMVSRIFKRIGRGVTVINAVGGYTGEARRIIMCVVPKRELFFLKQLVNETDAHAFMIVADVSEVHGHGFASRAVGEIGANKFSDKQK